MTWITVLGAVLPPVLAFFAGRWHLSQSLPVSAATLAKAPPPFWLAAEEAFAARERAAGHAALADLADVSAAVAAQLPQALAQAAPAAASAAAK